jgi:hypothetical protein
MLNRRSLLAAAMAGISSPALARRHHGANVQTRVFAFAGQSNEQNRGLGSAAQPNADNDSLIYQVGRWNADNMQIIPLNNTKLQHWGIPSSSGGSRSFLRYYANPAYGLLAPGDTILAVPSAHSGTSILQWRQKVSDGLNLRDDLYARCDLAMAQTGAVFDGLFFWLLERDAGIANDPLDPWHAQMPDAATFETELLGFVDDFRARYGLVWICLNHATDGFDNPLRAAFNQALDNVANARENMHVISIDTLPDNSAIDVTANPVHACASTQEKVAKRRFHAKTGILI